MAQQFSRAEVVMGNIDKYRYHLGIDKYRYFPLHENSEKILGNFEEILKERKDFEIISGTF